MSKNKEEHYFTIKFDDKSEWNNFKEDLKNILREYEIKYQYSEKVPNFHILYKSNQVRIQITWKDETLLVNLRVTADIDSSDLSACNEIFDLLSLFSGTLVDGLSPYEW